MIDRPSFSRVSTLEILSGFPELFSFSFKRTYDIRFGSTGPLEELLF